MSLIVLYLCYNTKSCSWTMLAGLNASRCCSTDKYCKSVTKFVEYFEEDLYTTRIWNVRCRVCSSATLQKAPEKISGPGHNAELLYLRDSINPTIYLFIYQFIPLFSSHFPLPLSSFRGWAISQVCSMRPATFRLKNIIQGQSPYWMIIQTPVTLASNLKGCSNSSEEWDLERMRDMLFMEVCVKTGCVAGWVGHKCRTQEQGS